MNYENIVLSNLNIYLDNYENVFGHSHRPLDLNTERYKKNIAFFGCSFTYGLGVENEKTYPSQVQKLSGNEWNCLNFGVPGGSLDLVYVIYNKVIKEIDIDCVVVQWPSIYRRMYFDEGKYVSPFHPWENEISKYFAKISDSDYCVVRNLSNLQVINSFKKTFNLQSQLGTVDITVTSGFSHTVKNLRELFEKYGIDATFREIAEL